MSQASMSRCGGAVAFALLAVLLCQPAAAQNSSQPHSDSGTTVSASAEMPALEAFVDGVVSAYMTEQKIAGAQVAIVRNGEPVLVKGYGIDAVEPARAVDPTQSLFRLGSISKTFTWLSLMQLAERGRLEITDPINAHLPDELDVPDEGFEQPIRIVDLMNHTAGFEDVLQHLFLPEGEQLIPLTEQLARYRPRRVREPGKLAAYSNYSTALAGAIVAHVSGMQFEQYVERNILGPLGMSSTTFREAYPPAPDLPQPMPVELAARRSQNIEWRRGAWRSLPHEYMVSMSPAASAVSTAQDMARYMAALLDPQRLESAGVLQAGTLAEMRAPSFQAAPGLPAMHHGFFNTPLGTHTPIELDNLSHGGATLHFMSFMAIIPDLSARATLQEAAAQSAEDSQTGDDPQSADDPQTAQAAAQAAGGYSGSLGIFATTNSAPGVQLVLALPEKILARYFPPAAREPSTPPQGSADRAKDYVGRYRPARRSYTKLEKALSLPSEVPISMTSDGYLVVTLAAEAGRFVEIGPDLFRRRDGDVTLAFRRDQNGRVTHLLMGSGAMERIGFFQTFAWVALVAIVAAITCVGIVVAALVRRRRSEAEALWEQRAAQFLTGAAVAWLAFMVLCAAWAAPFFGPDGQDRFIYTYPQALLKVALGLALLAVGLTVLAVVSFVPAWSAGRWTLWRRLRHSAAVVVLVALVATLMHWNVIGFHYY